MKRATAHHQIGPTPKPGLNRRSPIERTNLARAGFNQARRPASLAKPRWQDRSGPLSYSGPFCMLTHGMAQWYYPNSLGHELPVFFLVGDTHALTGLKVG